MEEDIIDNMADEAKSVEELLSRYQHWSDSGRGVARDVARRYLIIRDERDAFKEEQRKSYDRVESAQQENISLLTERNKESRRADTQYERATKAENSNATLRADVIELREALRSLYGEYVEARSDGDRYFGTWDGEETIGRLLSDPPEQVE